MRPDDGTGSTANGMRRETNADLFWLLEMAVTEGRNPSGINRAADQLSNDWNIVLDFEK